MNAKEVFRQLVKASPNWTQNKVAYQLGWTAQDLSQRMTRNADFRTDVFVDLLDVLGYDLVAVPKGSRLPNGSVKVDAE